MHRQPIGGFFLLFSLLSSFCHRLHTAIGMDICIFHTAAHRRHPFRAYTGRVCKRCDAAMIGGIPRACVRATGPRHPSVRASPAIFQQLGGINPPKHASCPRLGQCLERLGVGHEHDKDDGSMALVRLPPSLLSSLIF